jgi:hypothetical protein
VKPRVQIPVLTKNRANLNDKYETPNEYEIIYMNTYMHTHNDADVHW